MFKKQEIIFLPRIFLPRIFFSNKTRLFLITVPKLFAMFSWPTGNLKFNRYEWIALIMWHSLTRAVIDNFAIEFAVQFLGTAAGCLVRNQTFIFCPGVKNRLGVLKWKSYKNEQPHAWETGNLLLGNQSQFHMRRKVIWIKFGGA